MPEITTLGAPIKTTYEGESDTNAFTDAEKTKLAGVATGATANASDADLRDRSTHTGTQAQSTITNLVTDLGNKLEASDVANFETSAELDARDTANRARANHTGTQTASTISDFSTEVQSLIDATTEVAAVAALSGDVVGTTDTQTLTNKTIAFGSNTLSGLPVAYGIACSDETTDLTTGTAKATFRLPHAMTLTDVRASVTTAPVGSTIEVDINEGGVSVLSTVISIDASEKTSTTAATAPVISDSALADDAEITIDIDQVGSSTAGAGLKVWLIGTRA